MKTKAKIITLPRSISKILDHQIIRLQARSVWSYYLSEKIREYVLDNSIDYFEAEKYLSNRHGISI